MPKRKLTEENDDDKHKEPEDVEGEDGENDDIRPPALKDVDDPNEFEWIGVLDSARTCIHSEDAAISRLCRWMSCLKSQDYLIVSVHHFGGSILATCRVDQPTFQLEPVVIEICDPPAFGTLKPTSPPRSFRRVVRKSNPRAVLGVVPITNSYARFAQIRGYPLIQAFALCDPMLGIVTPSEDCPPLLFRPDCGGTCFETAEKGRGDIITIHPQDQDWLVWGNATEQDLEAVLLNACGKMFPTDIVRHVVFPFCFLPSSRSLTDLW